MAQSVCVGGGYYFITYPSWYFLFFLTYSFSLFKNVLVVILRIYLAAHRLENAMLTHRSGEQADGCLPEVSGGRGWGET